MIDLIVFAGQSNMSGRGDAARGVPCPPEAGFEYRPISAPGQRSPLREPFGFGEDRAGGLDDRDAEGHCKRRGSMVCAAVDAYFRATGRQVAALSAAKGGSSTAQWLDAYLSDALDRLEQTRAFLCAQGQAPAHCFLAWCQGESDGDAAMTAEAYLANTRAIFDAFRAHGVEHTFLVQIGHFNYLLSPEPRDRQYAVIRAAQAALCQTDPDVTLSATFADHLHHMIDKYHYAQPAYNAVGHSLGQTMAAYVKGMATNDVSR